MRRLLRRRSKIYHYKYDDESEQDLSYEAMMWVLGLIGFIINLFQKESPRTPIRAITNTLEPSKKAYKPYKEALKRDKKGKILPNSKK